MTIQKLLGLLFEHIESGDIERIIVTNEKIILNFDLHLKVINLNEDILTQYNKIFGYE